MLLLRGTVVVDGQMGHSFVPGQSRQEGVAGTRGYGQEQGEVGV